MARGEKRGKKEESARKIQLLPHTDLYELTTTKAMEALAPATQEHTALRPNKLQLADGTWRNHPGLPSRLHSHVRSSQDAECLNWYRLQVK